MTGPVQLTPIQHWFFEQQLAEPHHWNQSYLLELAADADLTLIERSLQQLFLHHDALRMRFRRTDAGWTQENDGPEHPMRIAHFNLSDLPVQEQQEAVIAAATKLQQNLDLASGGLAQAAIFELGPAQSARLLLVIASPGGGWHLLADFAGGFGNRVPTVAAGSAGATAAQDQLVSTVGRAAGCICPIGRVETRP